MAQDEGRRVWRLISHHEPDLKVPIYRKYLEKGFVAIGWPTGDLRTKPRMESRLSVYQYLLAHSEAMLDHKMKEFTNYWFGAVSLWAFFREMQKDDLIILRTGETPDPEDRTEAVLRIVGGYDWDPAADADPRCYQHRLPVVSESEPGPKELCRRAGTLDEDWYRMDAPDAELTSSSQQQWRRCTVLRFRVTL